MMRSSEENVEELDKSHVLEYTYTVADFVKMIGMKHPLPEVSNNEAYNVIVDHVAAMVHELDDERKKLFGKLPAKQEDIIEPTIEIKIGMNKFNVYVLWPHLPLP